MATQHTPRGLVALSASAIAAVYLVGYLRTQSADASLGATDAPAAIAAGSATQVLVAAAGVATPPPGVVTTRVPTPAPPAATQSGPTVAATSGPTVAAQSGPTTAATPVPTVAASSSSRQVAAAPPQASAAFKDGTYTGQGSSRRGGVVGSVAVQGGRIASVTIVQSTLQYPLRDIAALPGQVVQRQSAQIDTVSRATYSSQAFRAAVSQALSKAA